MLNNEKSRIVVFVNRVLGQRSIFWLMIATCAYITFVAGSAWAQAQLAPNQTHGFGNGRLITFTYLQNFDCVDQPTLDLNFNGIKAQSDPNEMQTPICQVVTEPTADPAGGDIKHTAHLYVLVPMFSVDNDKNPNDAMPCPSGGRPGELCGVALGNALISSFGFVPEANGRPLEGNRWSRTRSTGNSTSAAIRTPKNTEPIRYTPL